MSSMLTNSFPVKTSFTSGVNTNTCSKFQVWTASCTAN